MLEKYRRIAERAKFDDIKTIDDFLQERVWPKLSVVEQEKIQEYIRNGEPMTKAYSLIGLTVGIGYYL